MLSSSRNSDKSYEVHESIKQKVGFKLIDEQKQFSGVTGVSLIS